MAIDVMGILASRIYWFRKTVQITATFLKQSSFIERLNSVLPVGYFTYASDSNQIQVTRPINQLAGLLRCMSALLQRDGVCT